MDWRRFPCAESRRRVVAVHAVVLSSVMRTAG
jgi:hypothetical protein